MIRYIPAKQVDKKKYDLCIENARECRVYAYSWYLDCTCDRWDLLMQGDYEVVMPLPIKVKFGIPYIFTPPWAQQLGLFSKDLVDANMVKAFIAALPRKIRWIDYQFNSSNELHIKTSFLKKNYLLPLHQRFVEIQKNYNSNRKRISKNSFGGFEIDKQGDAEVFLSNYKNLDKAYEMSDQSFDTLKRLCEVTNGMVNIWNVFQDDSFIGGLIWLNDKRRITYLVPLADQRAKKLHIPTYMINELISHFQSQDLLLDFEGSMVKGVEKFYQSFGARPEYYSYYKKRVF